MAAPGVLALSLSSEVTKIGAVAGFVAIVGIALLALLFFAQARELKRLREWAGRAPERAREVEEQAARAAEAARVRPAPSVTPAVPVPPASRPAPAAGAPATPAPASPPLVLAGAGVGAPALLSATRFPGLVRNPTPSVSAPAPAPVALTTTPAPSRPASAGNGNAATPAPPRPPVAPATAAGAARAASPSIPPPTRPTQATPPPRSVPVAEPPRRRRRRRRRRLGPILLLAALVGVAALTFGVIQLFSNGGSSTTTKRNQASAPRTTPVGKGRNAATFSNGSVTVAVLNGTPVAGLAKRVADQLVAQGFKQGAVTNASEQTRSATLVSFLPGRRRAGTVVAKSLKAAALAPIDPTTRAIACPGTQPCPDVVVTVGADRAG